MHIRQDEALALLSKWEDRKTALQLKISHLGVLRELRGCTIGKLEGTAVEVVEGEVALKLDVQGAEFNGGDSPRPYLVCEFRNGDRYSFNT